MRKFGLVSLLFLCSLLMTTLHAQDDVTARFKYEQAEEAYNTGNYKASLDKLDEVDKLLGGKANPKTLYLRIMAQNKLLGEGDDVYSNIHLLQSLKANIAQYLTAYSAQSSLADKVRAVYQVNEERIDYSNNADFYTGFAALEAKDTAAALVSFTRGATAGDGQSMLYLGIINEAGYHLPKPDYTKALEWYSKAADKGINLAIFSIGQIYEEGKGVPQNYARAIEWYTKAADKGYTRAMIVLGNMYEQGNGVAKDMSKALEWYTKAADKGESFAMLIIAFYYYHTVLPHNYAKAMEWFLKADSKGDEQACFFIAMMYRSGEGVDVDYSKAIEWYKKDAAKGSAPSMEAISTLFKEGGHGIVKDEKLADEWLEKSKAAGGKPIK